MRAIARVAEIVLAVFCFNLYIPLGSRGKGKMGWVLSIIIVVIIVFLAIEGFRLYKMVMVLETALVQLFRLFEGFFQLVTDVASGIGNIASGIGGGVAGGIGAGMMM